MNGHPDVGRARQMLLEQLEALASLRNASTRDPIFKQWRQNTLTLIQRIWPGDEARGQRFRRIPFSAPSSKADARTVREFYERGCAEAATHLRTLLGEVERRGVPGMATPASAPEPEPIPAEDDFPTLELPGEQANSTGDARRQAAPRPVTPAPGPDSDAWPGADEPRPAAAAGPARQRPARSVIPPTSTVPRVSKPGKRNGPRERLKEMLGLHEERRSAAVPPAGPTGPPRAGAPPLPAAPRTPSAGEARRTPAPDSAPEPLGDWFTPEAAALEPDAPAGGARGESPVAHVGPPPFPAPRRADEDPAGVDVDMQRAMADFLRLSPVFASQARPVRRAGASGPAPFSVPAALALAALAADIDALDVPEPHRARTRSTLLDLARRIDAHDLPWETLREGVHFAMEFPSIGRRVLPLLVPYLDQAA